MAKPWKTDLFATTEDDIRQFGAALFALFRAAPRAMAKRVGTTTRRAFAHRIDLWDSSGENIVEHLAEIEDLELAMATYRAACGALAEREHHFASWCDGDRGHSAGAHGNGQVPAGLK